MKCFSSPGRAKNKSRLPRKPDDVLGMRCEKANSIRMINKAKQREEDKFSSRGVKRKKKSKV